MLTVKFYERVDDVLLKFAVIVSRHRGKWVFCKHKARGTYECPGGHREPREAIEDCAKRELWEETGAKAFTLTPVCVYSVTGNDGVITNEQETFGMLYFAEITAFGELPPLEMERVELFDELPENWTYPEIQPRLLERAGQVSLPCEREVAAKPTEGFMGYKHNPALTENARSLRQEMTKEERHLWYDFLRSYPVRFLRQKVVDNYIADFYCAKAKLVIELDGAQHYETEGLRRDKIRTEKLEKRDLTVIRIPNNEVSQNFAGVCKYIDMTVKKSLHRA